MRDLFSRFCAWVKDSLTLTPTRGGVLAFTMSLGSSYLLYWIIVFFLSSHTSGWLAERQPLIPLTDSICDIPTPSCLRLVEQITMADSRAAHHFWIMRFYQIHYFGLISTAYWSGTMAGALLVLVVKKGWDDVEDKIKGLFLGLSTAAAFFGGFPGVMAATENIDKNKTAYLAYDDLSGEIRSYLVGHDHPSTDPLLFMQGVDLKLDALNGVYFGVDETKMDAGKSRVMDSQPK